MSRKSRVLMFLSGTILLTWLFAWTQASASDANVVAARDGILSFTDTIDSLATQPALSTVVPLTGLDPIGPDGLGLSDLVRDAFNPLTSADLNGPADLQSALEGLDDNDVDGVAVTIGTGSGCAACTTAVSVSESTEHITATVPVHAERTVSTPMRFSSSLLRLNGGAISAKVELTTTLEFRFIKALRTSAPSQAFAVTNSPTVQFATTLSTPTPLSFTANVGLSEVNVGGSITTATATAAAAFSDPDGLDGITLDEFGSTAIADLAPLSAGGSLDASVTLDGTLNGTGTDATVAFNDPDLSNGFQPPTINAGSLGSLASFNNLSPESLINGLAGFAAGLQSLQIAGDQKLPFIQESVAKAGELAKPVLDVVQRQTVLCGAVAGSGANPPTGDVSALEAGDSVYCRASAAGAPEAGTINWSIANGSETSSTNGASADGTVGATTSKDAVFAMTSDGTPDVSVTFSIKSNPADPASEVLDSSATRPVRTAQALLAQLKSLAGFNTSSAASYNPSTRALTFDLSKSFDIAPYTGGFDFGDQLKSQTTLFGLSPEIGATVTVDAGTATIDLTFGVILTETTASITPGITTDDGEANRFFLQVDPANPELVLDNAAVTGTVNLAGRLGFLEVAAVGDAAANDVDGTVAFQVGKRASDPTGPMLQVNVAGGDVAVDSETISNAILLPELAATLSTAITKSVNIGMSGGLRVTAKAGVTTPGTGTTLGEGTIGLSWPDVTVGTPTATPHTDFNQALKVFDDIDANNPQALLSLILDNLDAIVGGLGSLSGTAFDTSLPLVGTSPRALFAQLQTVRQSINELRGAVAGTIACGTTAGTPTAGPTGDPTNIAAGQSIFCRATTNKTIVGDPAWAVNAGTAVGGASTATTVGTATTPATTDFEVKPTAFSARSLATPAGYVVKMTFTDADGVHTLNFPEQGPPETLQRLEKAIEQKLGLPTSAFGLETIQIPAGSGNRFLAVRLGNNVCSTAMTGCSTGTDRSVPTFQAPLNIGLGSTTGSIVGVGATATVGIDYLARANLDLAVPLTGTTHTPKVLDTTGLQLAAQIGGDDVDLTANLGPLEVVVGVNGGGAGSGVFNLGAGFSLDKADAVPGDNNEVYDVSTYASGLDIALKRPTPPGSAVCGSVDPDSGSDDGLGTNGTNDAPVSLDGGDACANLSLKLNATHLGDVGIKIGDITNPGGTTTIATPEELIEQIGLAVLDWKFLLGAFPKLLERLQASLDGSAQSVKLPIVGDALDAGADVVGKVKKVADQLKTIGDQIQAEIDAGTDTNGIAPAGSPKDVEQKIHDLIYPVVTGAGILVDTQLPVGVDAGDLRVQLSCGVIPCLETHSLRDIDDARITMMLGQGDSPTEGCTTTCVTGATLPFDVGLDGLPLRITGAVQANVGWRALADLGLSRTEGPYLVVGGPNHNFGQPANAPEVSVGARVGLANSPCSDQDRFEVGASGFSNTRCLQGTLGFLFVNARDGETDTAVDTDTSKSEIRLLASLQLTNSGGGDRLTFGDLTAGRASAAFNLNGEANVDLRIRTGLRGGEDAGFPSILGTFHARFAFGGNPNTPPSELEFDNLALDVGSFISKTVGPLLKDVKNITSPLKPIIDTLQAPLPVVSDLSRLVGGEDITLLSLLEAASGADLSVVKSVIQLINFVNTISSVSDSRVFPLGGGGTGDNREFGTFKVKPDAAKGSPVTPDQAEGLIVQDASLKAGEDIINDVNGANVGTVGSGAEQRDKTFGVEGLAFPFLQDASNVFSVLMGSDVDLVTYDAGPLSAKAGLSYDFGPFFIGPVPVTVGIFGSAEIKGRFSIGYDTSGLRRVLSGASGEHLLDGVKIFDLDRAGNDVPEVQLIGEVGARAAVDMVVISAGVEGGIRLTLNLNLNDSPNKDGVLRIDEVLDKLQNPICLFDVAGALDFFLRAFVEVDLFFYSDRYEFELLTIRLLDFSLACTPPKPVLAVNNAGVLTLNMGSSERRTARNFQKEATDEKFEVRAMGGGSYSVKAFGKLQEFGPVVGQASITKVIGDGADGSDQILMQPGGETTINEAKDNGLNAPTTIPFTAVAELTGGTEDDVLIGGGAADTLDGGDGNDQIMGADGADTITGGIGNDAIDGQGGSDTSLSGDGGDDRINGGPGGDRILGGADNDTLTGGPGTDPAAGGPGADGDDTVIGNSGNDTLSGSFGSDKLYGDSEQTCSNFFSSSGIDSLDGGPGDDFLYGGPLNDSLIGKGGDDLLCGNGGDDRLDGDSLPEIGMVPGDDDLRGASGRDYLVARQGDDALDGGTDNDYLDAGVGRDDLIGGLGVDYVVGGDGADIAVGDNGTIAAHTPAQHDTISQSARAALVTPASGDSTGTTTSCPAILESATLVSATPTGNGDCVFGGAGHDVLFGERGTDRVYGDNGADYVSGDDGNDYLRGGELGDTMLGGNDDDEMYGDSGNDRMFGNAHQDLMRGGIGDDYLEGNGGADEMYGDANADDLIGGSGAAAQEDDDVNVGGSGSRGDLIYGNADADVIAGDNATITRPGGPIDFSTGGPRRTVTLLDVNSTDDTFAGADRVEGGEGSDRIYGQAENDTLNGNERRDFIEGNAGTDTIHGNDGDDHLIGGTSGNADAFDAGDHVFGDAGDDIVLGDNGSIALDGTVTLGTTGIAGTSGGDEIEGNADEDILHGQDGDDTMHGNDDFDRMYGELGADDMTGDAGPDYMLGDQGTIVPTSGSFPGGAPKATVLLLAADAGGIDTMHGGTADDHMYGGAADDVMSGYSGDDYMEGNGGQDSMYGFNATIDDGASTAGDATDLATLILDGNRDQDDMLGGSSAVNPESDKLDAGETIMLGNLQQDVMLGDNGEVVRTISSDPLVWSTDLITGGAARTVTLLYADEASCSTGKCGGDTMSGNDANDRMYGEGGNDLMHGNAGEDYVEGNQNDDAASAVAGQYGDQLFGDAAEDDLIGGSALTTACSGSFTCGKPDAGDTISGGGEADVITGDNAVVSKVLAGQEGDKLTQGRPGMLKQRTIALHDLGDTPTAGTAGGDRINGDAGEDVILGQRGNDRINGDGDADYAEGGPDRDWVQGDAGDDDLVGGSRDLFTADTGDTTQGQLDSGDVVSGGAGDDLITGDNAIQLRVGTPSRFVFRVGSSGALETQRLLRQLDLSWSNGYLGAPTRQVFGGDQLSGGSGVDVIFGQDGDDQISGGADDDYAEGNGGYDRMYGDRTLAEVGITPVAPTPDWPGPVSADHGNVSATNGQDDLVGGSSTAVFRDTADEVHGDGSSDYVLGDNGTVVRDILDAAKAPVTTVAAAQAAQTPLTDRVYTIRYAPADATTPLPVGAAYVRHGASGQATTRFCLSNDGANKNLCEATGAWGGDHLWGGSGDDTLYGQDGDDHIYGDTGSTAKPDTGSLAVVDDGGPTRVAGVDASNDDDIFGELGRDSLWGESGDDSILGDRGGVRDVWQDGSQAFTYLGNQVPKVEFYGFTRGQVIRVTDLLHDVNGDAFLNDATMPHPGLNEGGVDRIRGGTDHDTIHAGFGDDLANGDSGGDWVFGDDGADVLWGGKGCDETLGQAGNPAVCYPGGTFDPAPHRANGETEPEVTDYLNGGKGGTSAESLAGSSGSDVLDWRVRGTYTPTANPPGCSPNAWPLDLNTGGKKGTSTTVDPCSWFELSDIDDSNDANNQHHQGVDWIYGGWDRDILQGDVADNGPNEGDRLLDWNGTYNLYTHCNAAYGGFNDVRQHSPDWQLFLQKWVWAQGAGQQQDDATTNGTSAFVELALVYPGVDNDHGSGKAYPSTPGHFDNPNACAP